MRRSRRRLLEWIRVHPILKRLAGNYVKIGQTVIVVVEPGASGTGAFQQRTKLPRSEAVRKLNA